MEKISMLIVALQAIIILSGTLRVTQCYLSEALQPDIDPSLRKRSKNTIFFCIFSVVALQFIDLVAGYFVV